MTLSLKNPWQNNKIKLRNSNRRRTAAERTAALFQIRKGKSMITFFNRKEVCITYDMKRQAEVRNILQGRGIDYRMKVINRKSSSAVWSGTRAYTGTHGKDLMMEYEYHIYVHKDDYEEALFLIGG